MKKRIALVTGGYSGERDISLKSGKEVYRHLDRSIYEVFWIQIEEENWYYLSDAGKRHPVDRKDFTIHLGDRKLSFDCAFIVIHGTPGEDGKLQGYFDLLNLPYTSCNRTTSSVTFNKFFTNRIARALGVRTADALFFTALEEIDHREILKTLGLPCFVKPNNGGSSVGISRVDVPEDLHGAILKAFGEDREIVIEKFIPGFELTCGILRSRGQLIVLPLTKIISRKAFFDYEAKYTDGMAEEITPAPVDDELRSDCQELSGFLYHQLNCRGIVRFDYIVNGRDLYFLEVNTIPGFTQNSIVPKMATVMGLSLTRLYTMAIEEVLR
ncbi:MAG TPA: D-alanine--D-alanine ligase [Bacteroidales bacterium]|nr:D-alanine--D-alanine ligase [Bacteroidales bacterium]HRZ22044.1 D-alanine--D-alanine ligase [Bacteroidales bacterium]